MSITLLSSKRSISIYRKIATSQLGRSIRWLMGPDCIYSRRPTHTTDVPDFNCHHVKKKRNLFDEEQLKLSHFVKKAG
ncbi:unnamed protein product [Rhizophagus irregularis]|nr:unnamed protein product [Rhizophagus irregularis]